MNSTRVAHAQSSALAPGRITLNSSRGRQPSSRGQPPISRGQPPSLQQVRRPLLPRRGRGDYFPTYIPEADDPRIGVFVAPPRLYVQPIRPNPPKPPPGPIRHRPYRQCHQATHRGQPTYLPERVNLFTTPLPDMTMESSAASPSSRDPLASRPPRDSASRSSNQSSSPGGVGARAPPAPLAHPPAPPAGPQHGRHHAEFPETQGPQGPPRLPPLQRHLRTPLQMALTPPVTVEPGWEVQPHPRQTPDEARTHFENPTWVPVTMSPREHASDAWLERFRDWAPNPPPPGAAGGRITRQSSADAERPPGPLPPIQGPTRRETPGDHQ